MTALADHTGAVINVWHVVGIAYLVALAALAVVFIVHGRAKSRGRAQAPGTFVGAGPLAGVPGQGSRASEAPPSAVSPKADALDSPTNAGPDWGIFDRIACRACGCTEDEACWPDGCYWVEWDLCSSCVPTSSLERTGRGEDPR